MARCARTRARQDLAYGLGACRLARRAFRYSGLRLLDPVAGAAPDRTAAFRPAPPLDTVHHAICMQISVCPAGHGIPPRGGADARTWRGGCQPFVLA